LTAFTGLDGAFRTRRSLVHCCIGSLSCCCIIQFILFIFFFGEIRSQQVFHTTSMHSLTSSSNLRDTPRSAGSNEDEGGTTNPNSSAGASNGSSASNRKEKRKAEQISDPSPFPMDTKLVPKDMESALLKAVFELGLKFASPKVLMKLMMSYEGLNSEHIKSHLQKYRIEWARSENEFLDCYGNTLQTRFHSWYESMVLQSKQGTNGVTDINPSSSSSSSSSSPPPPSALATAHGSSADLLHAAMSSPHSFAELPVLNDDLHSYINSNSFGSSSASSSSSAVNNIPDNGGGAGNAAGSGNSHHPHKHNVADTNAGADNDRRQRELLELQIKEQIKFTMHCWQMEYENSTTDFEEFNKRLNKSKQSKL
jgi:SHAQKYF class myb-like DNA-binding protein